MSTHLRQRRQSQSGFSLIEMITVVAILILVMGAVFRQIITLQQRYRVEEARLDIGQESREFLDQMVRDLHQVGHPSARVYDTGLSPSTPPGANLRSPANKDVRVAAGLVSYSYNDLWFEGDVDGDGQVEVVEYRLIPAGGPCPCSIQRRQQKPKLDDTAPLNQTGSTFSTELQNVINSGGSGGPNANTSYSISGTGPGGVSNNTMYGGLTSPYIFEAFDKNGATVAPADLSTAAGTDRLATIRSIKITINVLAKQSASDLQTGRRSVASMTATARMSNF